MLGGGGAGDGNESGEEGSNSGDIVNQQIAQALVRLQQDMTNVLDRLNRLETQYRNSQVSADLPFGISCSCTFLYTCGIVLVVMFTL